MPDLDDPQFVRVATTLTRGTYRSGRELQLAPHLFVGPVDKLRSAVMESLEAGLAAHHGKDLVNSVKGEDDRLAEVLRW